ncbi:fimbria/pilus periplasmic chaperone [Pseudomonas fragi]|uniref:fimbrial biogenesis chaperone n=1 Tax=Pseudomonas fragi TaxID=296 RepID=UPI0021C09971|nr:fimbria/pilus periplasmic chaperone [Pseudomonas fragi]UXL37065.1 fimbria/pilus periplasmic chaperone [Pseudomonas fragi]
MKFLLRSTVFTIITCVCQIFYQAQASVVVSGTRVIFPGQDREVTVRLTNNGLAPALVQAWLDDGSANITPDKMEVPFTVAPAIFRLDTNKGQALRLIYTQEPLAQDKESLYWLNILEVPPKSPEGMESNNKLQLAFRTRIKVIYRPKGLLGSVKESPGKVQWSAVRASSGEGYVLRAFNPTPYFVNLGKVTLKIGKKEVYAGADFVKPGETQDFLLDGVSVLPDISSVVSFVAINDFGAGVVLTKKLE